MNEVGYKTSLILIIVIHNISRKKLPTGNSGQWNDD